MRTPMNAPSLEKQDMLRRANMNEQNQTEEIETGVIVLFALLAMYFIGFFLWIV